MSSLSSQLTQYKNNPRANAMALGLFSLFTPITLYFGGKLFFDLALEPSFSDYYYTEMKWVFTLQLAAPALLIFFFRDEKAPYSDVLAKIISVSAFLVIIFPTSRVQRCPDIIYTPEIAGLAAEWVHFFAAGILFAVYAILFGFSLAQSADTEHERRGYTIVATIMASTMLLSAINMVLTSPICASTVPESTFYSEVILSTAIFFGWLNYVRHRENP